MNTDKVNCTKWTKWCRRLFW